MGKLTFILVVSIFVLWCLFGTQMYMRLRPMVTNKFKHCVLALLSGPIIWLYGSFMLFFKFVDNIVIDRMFDKFERWLIK